MTELSKEKSTSISTPDQVEGRLATLEFDDANWFQTMPGNGFSTLLRPYNRLQPFFDKTWRPSETEPIRTATQRRRESNGN